jgi:hypothetical protein
MARSRSTRARLAWDTEVGTRSETYKALGEFITGSSHALSAFTADGLIRTKDTSNSKVAASFRSSSLRTPSIVGAIPHGLASIVFGSSAANADASK